MNEARVTTSRQAVDRLVNHLRNPLLRNGYALTLSSATSAVVGLGYWLLAARYYPVDVVGRNSAIIAAMTLLAGLAGLYLDGTIVRFLPRAGLSSRRLIWVAYGLSALVAALSSTVFLLGIDVFSPALSFMTENVWLSIAFVVSVVAWCLFAEQDAVLTGLRQATLVPVENVIYAVAKLVLLVLFASLLPATGIFISWALPAVLLILPVNLLISRRLMPRHVQATAASAEAAPLSLMVRYAAGNYVGVLFTLAYSTVPPLLVLHYAGSSANAYFYLPWVIASLTRLAASNMGTSLTVEGIVDEGRQAAHFRSALLSLGRLVVPAVLAVALLSQPLLSLFGATYASEGAALLRLLVLATIPNLYVSLTIGRFRAQNHIARIVLIHATTAILMLGMSLVLLPRQGIIGVGVAWLVAQTLVAIATWATQVRFARFWPAGRGA